MCAYGLHRACRAGNLRVRAYGNALAAAAMRGLTAEEFSRRELDAFDGRFAIKVYAGAVKKNRQDWQDFSRFKGWIFKLFPKKS
jgi:hypothetical protein